MLEVAPADLEVAAGKVRLKRAPSRSLSLADMAVHSGGAFPGSPLPANLDEVGLEVTAVFRSEKSTYASGVHAVKVEVDPRTAKSISCAMSWYTTVETSLIL